MDLSVFSNFWSAIFRCSPSPDGTKWCDYLTALSTFYLAVFTLLLMCGVFIAGIQLYQDRRFRQVQETGRLFDVFDRTSFRKVLNRIDKDYKTPDELEKDRLDRNRQRAYRLYLKIKNFNFKRYPKSALKYRCFAKKMEKEIKDIVRITERLEIYIRRDVASGSLVAEHLVYEVVVMYYVLQDILQERSGREDWNYEGFRDLALRMQDHSKLHPLDAELRNELKYAKFPPLQYRGGDSSSSLGYDRSLLLNLRLWFHSVFHD